MDQSLLFWLTDIDKFFFSRPYDLSTQNATYPHRGLFSRAIGFRQRSCLRAPILRLLLSLYITPGSRKHIEIVLGPRTGDALARTWAMISQCRLYIVPVWSLSRYHLIRFTQAFMAGSLRSHS
jgi:hypothetical protein